MKSVILSLDEWHQIVQQIAKHHPRSVWMIRSKMRNVLGFTPREHREWVPKMDGGYQIHRVHLDFYDESKKTMFLLKYGDHIKQDKNYDRIL